MTRTASRPRIEFIDVSSGFRTGKLADQIRSGLAAASKSLPCCYFYDQDGSDLFEEICRLPEYYLMRAETEIFQSRADRIASLCARDSALLELGSGSSTKTRLVIEAFLRRAPRVLYVPIDICSSMLRESAVQLLESYPALDIVAVLGEYRDGLKAFAVAEGTSRLIMWMGSNVGNFHRDEAAEFLRLIASGMAPGDRLLIGIDLRKSSEVLERAYDDPAGVTAQFNLNILARINRDLSGNFDLTGFRHRAVYDCDAGRVEMYLVSTRPQTVRIEGLNLDVAFADGETIHTENSYKYSPAEIDTLLARAGLVEDERWTDSAGLFAEVLARRA